MPPMVRYLLQAKIEGQWQTVRTIEAPNHKEGFRKAMLCLGPELYDKPIRLEVDETHYLES
jgi:hypothetical protein